MTGMDGWIGMIAIALLSLAIVGLVAWATTAHRPGTPHLHDASEPKLLDERLMLGDEAMRSYRARLDPRAAGSASAPSPRGARGRSAPLP
jgi:hypothetical protein